MAIIDIEHGPLTERVDTPKGMSITPAALGAEESQAPERPGIFSVVGSAFNQNNLIASAVARQDMPLDDDPDFDVWGEIKGTKYEPHLQSFADIPRNRGATDAMKRQLDMEEEDRRTLAAAPWYQSVPAVLAASVADPTMLIPGMQIVKGVKGGVAVVRTAAAAATLTGAATAVQELGLHQTQELRTAGESAIDISASVLLGGLLGAGTAKLLSRAEWSDSVGKLERALATPEPALTPVPDAPFANSMGAAAIEPRSLNDLSVSGLMAQGVTSATKKLNPGLRIMQSESPLVREIGTRLFEMTRYLKGNDDGFATPTAVETLRKEWNAGLTLAVRHTDEQYLEYLKSVGQSRVSQMFPGSSGALSRQQFKEAAGKAMRRNDEDDNPFVAAVAQRWRKEVFEPLKEAAIAAKLLPEDVNVTTAASYFSRMWNRHKLSAEEGLFKKTVKDWVLQNSPRWADAFDGETAAKSAKLKDDALKEYQVSRRIERDERFGGNIGSHADEIANEVFDVLSGRMSFGTRPEWIKVQARGPLKERTFNIPDELVERWLENDVDLVGRRYARIMGTDVELAKMFGRVDMQDQLDKIREQYRALRSGIIDEAKLRKLEKAEAADLRDITSIRDMMRGVFAEGPIDREFGRIARIANSFNYVAKMGGVVLASLGDVIRVPMVHGMMPFMKSSFAALANRKAFKMAVEEGRLAGNINERILAHRLATLAEINDYYTSRGPVEKFMENMANVASSWNGIRLYTDATKMLASVTIQNRILKNTVDWKSLPAKDRRYMNFVGINEDMADRISKQFEKHGEIQGGVHTANTEMWTDPVARRAFRAAINKDVDSTIVTKSVADVPIFANTPLGRMVFQFSTFNLASHQRVLLRGLQEDKARFISGVIALTTLGMVQTYLGAVAGNRVNKLPDFSENPGWWISEGLDRSGVVSVFFQVSNAIEKLSGYNPLKAPLKAFDAGSTGSTRLQNRNPGSLLGPTAGTIVDVGTVAQVPHTIYKGEDVTQAQKNAAERLLPYNSYPGIRQFLRYFANPQND